MSMDELNHRVDQWLRDAHAMEAQAEEMLRDQLFRIESYPEIKEHMQEALAGTRRQRERLAECLKRRGAESSGLKDMAARAVAMLQTIGTAFAGDEIVKGVLACYAFTQGARACYLALETACRAVGDEAAAGVCADILREKEEFADRLWAELPQTVRLHLTRHGASLAEAKR